MLPMGAEPCSWMWPHCLRFLHASAMQRSGVQDSSQARYVPGTPQGIRLHTAVMSRLREAERQGGNCHAGNQRASSRACTLCKAVACSSCRV